MQFLETDDRHSLCKLTGSGRILVSAMRRAPSGAAATMSCFVDAFGEKRGRPCFVVFLQIVHSLALYGRRRMRVGTEAWPILTHDEVAFVRCIDAGIRGDAAALEAHVAWLVRREGAAEFTGYAETMAALMPDRVVGDALAAVGEGFGRDEAENIAVERPAPRRSASAFPVAIDQSSGAISGSVPKA